jgi:hypothetical protein
MRTLTSPELGHFTVCRLDSKIVATSLVPGEGEQRDEMVGFEKAQIYTRNMTENMLEALLGNKSFTIAPETTHSVKASPFCSRVEPVSSPQGPPSTASICTSSSPGFWLERARAYAFSPSCALTAEDNRIPTAFFVIACNISSSSSSYPESSPPTSSPSPSSVSPPSN